RGRTSRFTRATSSTSRRRRSGWCPIRSTGSSTTCSASAPASRSQEYRMEERTLEPSSRTLAGWDAVVETGPAEERISQLRTLGHVLARRWRLVAGFVAAGLLGMAIVTLCMERRYTATAVVHIENDTPHVTKIDQVVSAPNYLESVEYFQDQV